MDKDIAILSEHTGAINLPEYEGWPQSVHDFAQNEVLALQAALASGRPLLIRGEPGTGKTQIARAAAVLLKRNFVSKTFDAHTEARDLFWTFDAVKRLAEAQVSAAKVSSLKLDDSQDFLSISKYLDEKLA